MFMTNIASSKSPGYRVPIRLGHRQKIYYL